MQMHICNVHVYPKWRCALRKPAQGTGFGKTVADRGSLLRRTWFNRGRKLFKKRKPQQAWKFGSKGGFLSEGDKIIEN